MLTEGMYIADRYEIIGKIGAGGMSDVYKAKDLTLGRFVAIPSPVPNTNISLQYAVLALLAAMYGPVAGGLIGFIGHTLVDLSWGGSPWWSWVITSAFVGVVIGVFAKKLNVQVKEK